MNEAINIIIGGVFTLSFAYFMIFVTRELALRVLMFWQGKKVEAELKAKLKLTIGLPRTHAHTYHYLVEDRVYEYTRLVEFSERIFRKEVRFLTLRYLPDYPSTARPAQSFPFNIIEMIILMLFGFLCATMIVVIMGSNLAYVVWLLLLAAFVLLPRLTTHPAINRSFGLHIPEHWKES